MIVAQPGVDFSVQDVSNGWVKGLRAVGCEVVDFNLADRVVFYAGAHLKKGRRWVKAFEGEDAIRVAVKGLEAVCYEFNPDIVLVVSGFFIPEQIYSLMRARGHHVVLLCTESPYEDDRQLTRAPSADAVILNDPTNLEQFRAVNPRTWYLPHAYDPDMHRPSPPVADAASDFCFVGTGFPSRVAFLEQVDWGGIDVALAGNWQGLDEDSPLRKFLAHDIDVGCPNDQAVVLYQSAKVSANLYRRETTDGGSADGWAMGPREVELAACGTPFLRERRGEGDEVLSMMPTFTSPQEFGDQLRRLLADGPQREAISVAGRAAVGSRTFTNSARELLRLLGN